MRLISTKSLFDGLRQNAKRFPFSTALLVILTIAGIVFNHMRSSGVVEQLAFFVCYYCATTAMVALSLKLWSEQTANRHTAAIVQCIVHALWLALVIWLTTLYFSNGVDTWLIKVSSCVLATLSMWVLPFLRSNDDVPMRNFILTSTKNALVSAVVALTLFLGIVLLHKSLNLLLMSGIYISDDVVIDEAIVSFGMVMPMTFLTLMPSKESMFSNTGQRAGKIIGGIAHYLLLPLGAAYLLTLYIYAGKILFTWQLPNGWVSTPVTVLVAMMLVLLLFIYPARFKDGRLTDRLIMRWLPLLVLPLLVLMSIGIGRRISDYGLTMTRLYGLLFNVWCYAVCVGLFVTATKRLRWVIASFGVAFFVFSAGPWSVANITKYAIKNDITSTLAAAGFTKLPLNDEQYENFSKHVRPEQFERTNSKLVYLKRAYDDNEHLAIIDSTVMLSPYQYHSGTSVLTAYELIGDKAQSIPDNAKRFQMIEFRGQNYSDQLTGDTISFKIAANGKQYDFIVARSMFTNATQRTESQNSPLSLKSRQGATLCVDQFEITDSTLQLGGILFIK